MKTGRQKIVLKKEFGIRAVCGLLLAVVVSGAGYAYAQDGAASGTEGTVYSTVAEAEF